MTQPPADLRATLQESLGAVYEIEKELGGGGMSRVFLARETALGRRVVIKVLPPELAASVNADRFKREIQMAAQLQHSCIVPVLATGMAAGLPYFTMPFVEGESLRAKLDREGELPLPEVIRYTRDVLEALSHAHEQGLVHRDIKPANVLLSKHHALVADFGVAKALSAATDTASGGLTSLGVALGTPAYMAPEQAAADPAVDSRADLYAVGAVAYEMLTGQKMFSARSPAAMLAAQATETPEPVGTR
ncbi:MAG: serine/threonine protein kinase, partial [Gemmatimonadota bacterium]|nr:serine/threonine protein kinase [Gemmatimonadota bacterium]